MHKFLIVIICSFILLVSCSSGDGETGNPEPAIETPEAATLVFPYENETCYEGKVLSASESEVTFEWNPSTHTDSYTIYIKNLKDGQTQTLNTTTFSIAAKLQRNAPYSWQVESKAEGVSETAKSPVWKFYNAGEGTDTYAPFPAETLYPEMGSIIDTSSDLITLSWNGSDPDNDIMEYDVYFDTVTPPLHFENAVMTNSLNVSVSPGNGTIYYWSIVTRDADNNTSQSEVFQFKVN
nr:MULTISPECIES: hypothetical protein [unclassified Allomuricauda]|tara:strand:- start:3156 stop:3866 length:711 start_codon:yes stop_codon:yes gene_type:complete